MTPFWKLRKRGVPGRWIVFGTLANISAGLGQSMACRMSLFSNSPRLFESYFIKRHAITAHIALLFGLWTFSNNAITNFSSLEIIGLKSGGYLYIVNYFPLIFCTYFLLTQFIYILISTNFLMKFFILCNLIFFIVGTYY